MPFDTALSGIRAASSELEITGNNIANASTTGFKQSRAEFGDVYATSVLGAGNNAVGAGIEIQNISQSFTQGNITFTENALDMAINGNGFFVLSDDGDTTYTRSGAFGIDSDGYVVSNNNSRLQGYSLNESGVLVRVEDDIRLETTTIEPNKTSLIEQNFNMDATDPVLPSNGQQFVSAGPEVGIAQAGTLNGYSSQAFDITDPDGNTATYVSSAGDSAAVIAGELNSVQGITATASTTAALSNFTDVTNLQLTINNVTMTGATVGDFVTQINQLTNSTLPGISASLNAGADTITLTSSTGLDLNISIAGGTSSLDVTGTAGAAQSLVTGGADTANVGGALSIVVEEEYSVSNFVPDGTALFGTEATIVLTDVEVNSFDPENPGTYNSATSTTIYDSFGVPHVMTQYFVKQSFDPTDATSSPNHWQMHVLIDGNDVGNPDPTAADPTAATRATYNVFFNSNGSLDTDRTFGTTTTGQSAFRITNWVVESDNDSVALPPDVTGSLDLSLSSNFDIDIGGSTQFGTSFAVNSIDQNGFTAGQLSGLNVDESGVIFARFTNGESLTLGQVVLADFPNQQGLQAIGDSSWAQTFESGAPTINEPGTASLGAIQSGALEESNVDISEQLVALILAQRNFQASAKTIETADQTTQTIINLR